MWFLLMEERKKTEERKLRERWTKGEKEDNYDIRDERREGKSEKGACVEGIISGFFFT